MLNTLLTIGFFIVLGAAWQFVQPKGITAESLRKQVSALVALVLLPLIVFFTMSDLPLNEAALRILLYVLVVTLLALAAAWLWLWKTKLPGKTKGAYLIAAVFGNIIFLGLPLNNMLLPDWTMRVAIEYMLVANVILLYTAGAILATSLAEAGKPKIGKAASAVFGDYKFWLKEPVIWASLIGLGFNLVDAGMPAWAQKIEAMLYGALIPLLLLTVGLSLKWTKSWNNQLVGVAPVVVIQLVALPLLMWGAVSLFGAAGVNGTKALLLDTMLPATLIGFVICDHYKLDTGAYGLAFNASSLLALITVPIWFNVML